MESTQQQLPPVSLDNLASFHIEMESIPTPRPRRLSHAHLTYQEPPPTYNQAVQNYQDVTEIILATVKLYGHLFEHDFFEKEMRCMLFINVIVTISLLFYILYYKL